MNLKFVHFENSQPETSGRYSCHFERSLAYFR